MISNKILSEAIKKGYKSDVTNHKMSMVLLLLRLAEEFNVDLLEYLEEYNMNTFTIESEVEMIGKKIGRLTKYITPAASKSSKNTVAFQKDFQSLSILVHKWSGDSIQE